MNLHFSLLPAWRGAAPVQRAVMAGDEVTGATTFLLEEGLDTGPVLGTLTETVRPDDTAGALLDRLAHAGAGLLVATMDGLADGSLRAVPQPPDGVSHAPKLTTDEARVRWTLPAHVVDRHVRGCTPAPGAWTTLHGERLKLGPVRMPSAAGGGSSVAPDAEPLAPGELRVTKRAVARRHRVGTRRARRGPPAREEADARGRLGPRGPRHDGRPPRWLTDGTSAAEPPGVAAAATGGGPRRRSATAPSERTRRAEPTRFAAYTLLRAVDEGAYANLEMPNILRRHRLEGRDAAFATELGFGTIRWQGFYDAVIAEAAGRPTTRIDPQVLDVLRLGAHQLLGMRVATHAAADQTVGLSKVVAGAGAGGFVNAVMRRISERTA